MLIGECLLEIAPVITRALLLCILATATANLAHAADYFNSVNVPGANAGADGAPSRTSLAESFTTSTPDFSSITLNLEARNSSDGGSVMVFLVPDDGTGAATGFAGSPEFLQSGGVFAGFKNAAPVATISDASLTATPALVPLWVGTATISPIKAITSHNEYWVALVLSGGSSAGWEFNSGTPPGFGTTNQAFFNNFGGGGTQPASLGAYDMVVAAPEPAASAVLGVGLAGLGYLRWRSLKQSKPNCLRL